MLLLYATLFVSGGAILALELLASRIMTPYFGVSLYIWTGILSITLVALALGYWFGGKLAAGRDASPRSALRLVQLYALMPTVAAAGIVAACFAYPHLFASLAAASLVYGAFAAGLVLLFVPLVAASAMNPLLVAILLRRGASGRSGDAGAGAVFFVSTVGSVAGVLVTAFGLIPYLSNFASTLCVALVLALLTLGLAVFVREPVPARPAIGAAAVLACVLAVALIWNANAHTARNGPFSYAGLTWRVEGSYASLFGTVKVLRTVGGPGEDRHLRMYFQDGLTQNTADSAHRSISFYTYGLEALARAYRPRMRSALVLGLGAGMVPMALARSGIEVEVVDVDPVAPRVAQAHFGFDPARVRTHVADARTFVRDCPRTYDVVVVDLFHGDGTPDYLVTREFFRDLRRCLGADGVAVFNTFADITRPRPYAHFLVTLKAELPHLALYRPHDGGTYVNSFVVASAQALPAPVPVTLAYVPAHHSGTLWTMLSAPLALGPQLFEGGRVITDAANPAAHDLALMQMIYRRTVIESAPRGLLVN
jgi:predicted membrane-bound spermidine synthase